LRPPQKTGVSGTDTTEESAAAVQAAQQLACQCGCAVLVTGAVDYVTDGERLLALANGDPLMPRVTGVGCAMGALAEACVAAAPDAFTGAAACAAILGIAGERAAADRVCGDSAGVEPLNSRFHALHVERDVPRAQRICIHRHSLRTDKQLQHHIAAAEHTQGIPVSRPVRLLFHSKAQLVHVKIVRPIIIGYVNRNMMVLL
jgi:hypothetical protein